MRSLQLFVFSIVFINHDTENSEEIVLTLQF